MATHNIFDGLRRFIRGSGAASPYQYRRIEPFEDRVDAGRQLASHMEFLQGQDVVVVGLPRGGVPVAFEIANALQAPLDVLLVRKLGVPFQPELAFGAIGEDGVRVLNDSVVRQSHLDGDDMDVVERKQRVELRRLADRFRRGRDPISLAGRTVVIVDDGIATGATAKAACRVARVHGASRVVLAVPIGPPDVAARFGGVADEVVCLETPTPFAAVGQGYRHFAPTTDNDVVELLDRARTNFAERAEVDAAADPPLRDEEIHILTGRVPIAGHLVIPENPKGIVVFAHGSGSSRHSPRNRYVADVLNQAGVGTLLIDLLAPDEERNRSNVFDIKLLADRLIEVTDWLAGQPDLASFPVGYFGASTGAGAALVAAADPRIDVKAVVSRGGRPDLAGAALVNVKAPTLLIVGGRDEVVLDLNRRAQRAIPGPCELIVVPGATHLFEEQGALEEVARLARDWFVDYLVPHHQKQVSANG